MQFGDDTAESLESAVALVNTDGEPDTLATVADLDEFYESWGYTGRHVRTKAELEQVRAVRPALRELLLAPRDRAAGLVNRVLLDAEATPQLVRHDAYDWHIHAVSSERDFATRVLVETAMAMIDVIRADEHSRLQVCAAPGCDGVVFDQSRNRSRRFCSAACGNREAVAAYRARAKAGARD